jgi:RNA polymerase sigma-70 factor (ECF subfamily)
MSEQNGKRESKELLSIDFFVTESNSKDTEDLYRQIYNTCAGVLYNYGVFNIKVNAQDFTQEIFLKLLTLRKEAYEPQKGFWAWIRKIIHNRLIDQIRRKKTTGKALILAEDNIVDVELVTTNKPSHEPSPLDTVLAKELDQRIRRVLKHMPPKLKQALIMRHTERMSYEEIQQKLNIPMSTVKSRVRRGREMLEKRCSVVLVGMK